MNKLLLCFLLTFLTISIPGQERKQSETNEDPTSCELVQRILGTVHELAADGNVIVISKLGKGESAASLNRMRLKTVRQYLETVWKRPSSTVILAQGERVSGFGRLEFYTNGALVYQIIAKQRINIPIICYRED